MLRPFLAAIVLLIASSASHANNCDAIQSQIEAKIRASGVARFTLIKAEANAPVSGRVVGTCDRGTKKIVYTQSDMPARSTGERASLTVDQAPSKPRSESILTECKDGSVSVGGDCKK